MRFYDVLQIATDTDMDIHLKIFGSESGMFCNARQHARPNFFAVMEGKHEIRPTGTLQRLV